VAKTWDNLSEAEKIEELRRDVLNIINTVNRLDRHATALENGISEISGRAQALESQVSKLEHKAAEKPVSGQPATKTRR
jgi:predicted RNase H-like nuclease (RuvC/YqgF family)